MVTLAVFNFQSPVLLHIFYTYLMNVLTVHTWLSQVKASVLISWT